MALRGSSPPARGARRPTVLQQPCGGIIPACAGSTSSSSIRGSTTWDHPRLRGEHQAGSRQRVQTLGSSPPARGAQSEGVRVGFAVRIIPACAGSTGCSLVHLGSAPDHPRLRGEHGRSTVPDRPSFGSSPPARGARGQAHRMAEPGGIIPACAGSTGAVRFSGSAEADHPRLRGEHASVASSAWIAMGSSPPARGAQRAAPSPRVQYGSSPPARGARFPRSGSTPADRIIPACAGSTTSTRSTPTW